jgi:archaemetzincin
VRKSGHAIAVALVVVLVGACRRPAPDAADSPASESAPAVATPTEAEPPPTPATFTVCLQPLGEHEPTLLEPVARGVHQTFGFAVRTLAPQPLPEGAFYPPRQRYRADLLLDHLLWAVLPTTTGCNALIGFTAVDVSASTAEHADWGVLGLGNVGMRVAVVSTFRMRHADPRRVAERAVKVVGHELGHIVGIPHRSDGPGCLMNDAKGRVQSIDDASGALCAGERGVAEAWLGQKLPARDSLDWELILRR